MITTDTLSTILRESFHRSISVKQRLPDLFQVFLPFYFPDGDMIDIYVKPINDKQVLITDMGVTLMKLSYEFDLNTEKKKEIFNEILSNYLVLEESGHLFVRVDVNDIFIGLMQLIQTLIKVSDLSFLKRETVKSLFYEYFADFVDKKLVDFTVQKNYSPEFDTNGVYPSPYAILLPKQNFCIFPVNSDSKCDEVTITSLMYDRNNFSATKLVVFERQENINRKTLAKLSDVVDKQFSQLEGNQDRIVEYIVKASS